MLDHAARTFACWRAPQLLSPRLHLERKTCRSLPCRPFASACFEHSIDFAERGFGSAERVDSGCFAISALAAPMPNVKARHSAGIRYFIVILSCGNSPCGLIRMSRRGVDGRKVQRR